MSPFAARNRKKIFSATTISLIEEAERPRAFAVGKIFAQHGKSYIARLRDLFLRSAPLREFAQRSLSGELIIFREPALDCEETDEPVDQDLHRAKAK